MSHLNNSITCTHCQTLFEGYRTAKYCSDTCQKQSAKASIIKRMVVKSLIKFPDTANADTYVSCGICGYRSSDLAQHPMLHGLSQSEYRDKYGDIKSNVLKLKFTGKNNPGYNHNGKLSPFSKQFVNYTSDQYIQKLKDTAVQTKVDNKTNPLTLDYYIARGYSTETATIALSNRQSTFSLETCVDKYGKERGTVVWSERQEKWLKSFKKNNFSKISQELFDNIMKIYHGDVYYATHDRSEMKDYKNKEYRLKLVGGRVVLPDFIDINKKLILEFDGDYWHSAKVANPTKEAARDTAIIESGYKVLHIKEYDFKADKTKVIKECINFLTQ